jgi:hypothetical protein
VRRLGSSIGGPSSRSVQVLDEGRIDDAMSYLAGRPVADRMHVMLRQSRDEDVEFFYGRVTDGGVTTGRFLSGARVGADGLIASYEVTFDTEHVLVDDA